jgi:hypothetical protein
MLIMNSLPPPIMSVMAEHKDTGTPKQERKSRKRTWPRGASERTLWSKIWDRTGLRGTSLWDWLQLLIVPLVLALIGVAYTAGQQQKQQYEFEQQRAQEATFQTYLDVMRVLLLNEHLKTADADSSARAVAQAQTLAAFRQMSNEDKGIALRFLHDSSLIQKNRPIVERQRGLEGWPFVTVHSAVRWLSLRRRPAAAKHSRGPGAP